MKGDRAGTGIEQFHSKVELIEKGKSSVEAINRFLFTCYRIVMEAVSCDLENFVSLDFFNAIYNSHLSAF